MKVKRGVAVHGDATHADALLMISTDAADQIEQFPRPPEGVFAHSYEPANLITSAEMMRGFIRGNSAYNYRPGWLHSAMLPRTTAEMMFYVELKESDHE